MNEAFFRGVNNGLVKRAAGERFVKYVDPIGAVADANNIPRKYDPLKEELNAHMFSAKDPNVWDLAKGRMVGTTAGGALGALAGNNLRNKILLGLLGGGTGFLAGDYYDRGENSLVGRGASKLMSLFKSNRDKLLENKLNK